MTRSTSHLLLPLLGALATASLTAGAGSMDPKNSFLVRQYPAFYDPNPHTVAVLPFQNPTQARDAGELAAENLAATRKLFRLTIEPVGAPQRPEVSRDVVWPAGQTQTIVAFSPRQIAAATGPGAYVVSFYSLGKLAMQRGFTITSGR